MPAIQARDIDPEDHKAFVEEAKRRSQQQRRKVTLAEVLRSEIAKSAARFRRNTGK
jgi:hypothetical protein